MKLTKNILHEHKIHNSWNIAEILGNKLFLIYHPTEHGRYSSLSKWSVVGIKFKTDPDTAWYNNGCKTFITFGRETKREAFNEAVIWIKGKYGLEMTDRDPWGGYHPKGSLLKLEELIKQHKEIG